VIVPKRDHRALHFSEMPPPSRCDLVSEGYQPRVRIRPPSLLLLQTLTRMAGYQDQMLPGLAGELMTDEHGAAHAASASAPAERGKLRL
jgi:hypothetical protein